MEPSTRIELDEMKLLKVIIKKDPNLHWGDVTSGVYHVLEECKDIVNEGDIISSLRERMRKLDFMQSVLACNVGISDSLRQSLHEKLEARRMSLVPCPQDDELRRQLLIAAGRAAPPELWAFLHRNVTNLLGPSISGLLPDVELDILVRIKWKYTPPNIDDEQDSSQSPLSYEDLVTAIMQKLDMPLTFEDALLQVLERLLLGF